MYVSVLTTAAQIIPLHLETCTYLLVNSDHSPQTGFIGHIQRRRKQTRIGMAIPPPFVPLPSLPSHSSLSAPFLPSLSFNFLLALSLPPFPLPLPCTPPLTLEIGPLYSS